ncbi:MAG: 16S rRNA (uracil(1498)-N(3))-methyltransferase [Deltaproteobacteria bacterium]|nr:16S rRNA (uracil(1498)-N(3))-methyltransferase [Deltaproteobacteria bacterium]
MAKKRFIVEDLTLGRGGVILSGSEAHHISRVLRLRAGDEVVLVNGLGQEFDGVIEAIDRAVVRVTIIRGGSSQTESPVDVTLIQALVKGPAMEEIIVKAVELGVARILPCYTSRTIPVLTSEKAADKQARWQRLAQAALKQCRRASLPDILPPIPFAQVPALSSQFDLALLINESEKNRGLKEVLRESMAVRSVAALVGPEGGFSAEEVMVARTAGFTSVGLGRRILRAGTASLAILTILQYDLGDLG